MVRNDPRTAIAVRCRITCRLLRSRVVVRASLSPTRLPGRLPVRQRREIAASPGTAAPRQQVPSLAGPSGVPRARAPAPRAVGDIGEALTLVYSGSTAPHREAAGVNARADNTRGSAPRTSRSRNQHREEGVKRAWVFRASLACLAGIVSGGTLPASAGTSHERTFELADFGGRMEPVSGAWRPQWRARY